jgi:hypothetical protein
MGKAQTLVPASYQERNRRLKAIPLGLRQKGEQLQVLNNELAGAGIR